MERYFNGVYLKAILLKDRGISFDWVIKMLVTRRITDVIEIDIFIEFLLLLGEYKFKYNLKNQNMIFIKDL